MIFLAQDAAAAARQIATLEQLVAERGAARARLARRPGDPQAIGWLARESMPRVRQLFVAARGAAADDQDAFERKLYVIRRARREADRRRAAGRTSSTCRASRAARSSTRHADLAPDPGLLPGRARPRVRVGAVSRALALQHQHARLAGTSRIRSATSRTTARSTRSRATRTGCARARARCRRACSATTSPSSTRSCAPARPTPRASTTRSSSWCSSGRELPEAILMMIPEAWENQRAHGSRPARLLRVPLVPDGALGRPGLDRVHRRPQDRRRARPQRPAPVALRRDEGRLRRDGVGGRRARDRAVEHRASRSACTRARSSSSTSSRGGSSATRRSSGATSRAARIATGSSATACCSATCRAAEVPHERRNPEQRFTLQQVFGYTMRGSAGPDRADGGAGQVGDRLDGRGRGARVPLGPAAAALPLLQAALRPGLESGDGLDQRAAGDVALLDARRRAQPARGDARSTRG